jgi:hypothetical protein
MTYRYVANDWGGPVVPAPYLYESAKRYMLTAKGIPCGGEYSSTAFINKHSANISPPWNLAPQMHMPASSAFLETQAVISSSPPPQPNFS